MTLRIYNSLTRTKEEFVPLELGKVKMYVCGVTVYDFCHLGHARAYVVWDMVRRYLSTKFEVQYVQNITDIDDKILNRAKEQESTMAEISDRFIAEYDTDMAKLNILPADQYPRATAFIPQIIQMTAAIQSKGFAYAASGDVYYAVEKFGGYGKLSGRKLSDMQAGASGRMGESESVKCCPFDFALWKAAKPGEPSWESPWGNGRPGWHIECSAMVRALLGDTIDIHAGGADLQFPHHENEIAQSEIVTEKPLANYWMHNGFVNIENESGEVEKMSKSLNNFKTIRTLLEVHEPMVIRLFVLQAQYRQPISFSEEAIAATGRAWATLEDALLFEAAYGEQLGWLALPRKTHPEFLTSCAIAEFNEAMDDDFNTSVALSVIFQLAKNFRTERNNLKHSGQASRDSATLWSEWQDLAYMTQILGLQANPDQNILDEVLKPDVEQLIDQRKSAKQSKNYAEADRIRQVLADIGITLIDRKDGSTTWISS